MSLPLKSTLPHQGDEAGDATRCELVWPQSHHMPSRNRGFEVFLQIRRKSSTSVVATVHVDATFDLNERATGQVGKISAPLACGMESELLLQLRSARCSPKRQKGHF